jgi:hypothetical protein
MDLIEALARAVESQREPETGASRSWWRWLLVIVPAVLFAGVFVIWLWRLRGAERRELARLRHEKAVALVEADNARVAAGVAANDKIVEERRQAVVAAAERIAVIDAAITEAEDRYAEKLAAIDRISLWGLPAPL